MIIFSIEYLLRFWCCVELQNVQSRGRWMISPLPIVDLVSIVPFIVDLLLPRDNNFRGATLVRYVCRLLSHYI